MEFFEDGHLELYDLEADPYELVNIIDDPDAAETLAMMQQRLSEVLEASDEPQSLHRR